MQRSLEQLLMLARLEGVARDADPHEQCNPAEAAHEAVREVETSSECHGRIALDLQTPSVPLVTVPDRLVVSGVRNLLENALRHSPIDGEIRLQVSHDGNGRVVFRVLDSGSGMTPAECEQAVRRFWRRDRTGQGSGLGLSIVDAIARRYGGELRLSPRSPGGLSAELVLPS